MCEAGIPLIFVTRVWANIMVWSRDMKHIIYFLALFLNTAKSRFILSENVANLIFFFHVKGEKDMQ